MEINRSQQTFVESSICQALLSLGDTKQKRNCLTLKKPDNMYILHYIQNRYKIVSGQRLPEYRGIGKSSCWRWCLNWILKAILLFHVKGNGRLNCGWWFCDREKGTYERDVEIRNDKICQWIVYVELVWVKNPGWCWDYGPKRRMVLWIVVG